MKYIAFGIKYIINHQIFKKQTPLICGITVTNKCNLQCRHCKIASRGTKHISFEETITAIESFYIGGGTPTTMLHNGNRRDTQTYL